MLYGWVLFAYYGSHTVSVSWQRYYASVKAANNISVVLGSSDEEKEPEEG